jgi:putative toxin-antitoxin system antitoxin component (TIGR02293 family)
MPATSVIVEALGGRATLDNPVEGPADLSAHIRAGLPYASLESVMAKFDLRREEVSSALHLPPRTLARRKQEQRLSPDESDRLFRLVRLASQAVQVLGSEERASLWLRRANRALGGHPPIELLDTDVGARQVEEILGRIEHGVYS